jgi:arylsulfatase A-like enzyme
MVNRREFLGGCATAALAAAATPARPNILFITTDQQFAESASYRIGRKFIDTPNMDSLAASGMVFTRAYCANPLCVPSRASMFTGRYPTETGIMDNDDRTRVHLDPAKFPLMGRIFRDAGYQTAYYGKWHLPLPEAEVPTHGFETYDTKMDDPLTASHASAWLRSKAGRGDAAPFLMMASFLNPHNITEWSRGQKLPLGEAGTPPALDLLPPLRPNAKPQKNEPDIVGLTRRSYQAAPMFPVGDFDEKKWREYIWAYYRLIEKADKQIGVVLQALRETGLDKTTLVILSSDHGECMGSHGWNQKTILYEECARIPFIMSLPGVIKPGQTNHLVNSGIDMIPTLCDYAGFKAPPNLPGLSMRAAAEGRGGTDTRPYVVVSDRLIQGVEVDGKRPTPDGRMLRGQRYKYTAYSEGKQREALVDLDKDPGEMMNLAVDPAFRNLLVEHRAMLADWCRTAGDRFPVPTS